MRAIYYISFTGTTWTQIYPSNEPVLKLEQEAGEMFKRWKIDRFRLTKFKNTVIYASLLGMFFDPSSFGSKIYFRININGVPKFYFKDSIRAGNLNTQNSVYECTPDPDDNYQPILDLYQKKYNNPTKLFLFDETFFYPELYATSFSNIDFDSFSGSGQPVTYTNSGDPIGSRYARAYIGNLLDNSMVTVLITGLSYTGDAPQMQLTDDTGASLSNLVTVNTNGKYELTISGNNLAYLQLSQLNLTGTAKSGSFNYVVYKSIVAGNGATLYDLIDRILNHVSYFNLAYDVVSTILWNDALPTNPPASIATYMGANPSNDYVIEDSAVFNNLFLCRTDEFTTSKEDNLQLCFNDIMDILKSKRLYWFIDDDGKFRIEHEKYFRSYDPQIDLTTITFVPDKPEVDKKIYSYEGEYYNQINIIEENAKNEDWQPVSINYDINLTGPNIKDERIPVTTDLKNLLDNPGGSGSGLTLLRCDANNNVLIDVTLVGPTNYYPNQKLSPAWISINYMQYFAEALIGTTVIGSHTFIHVRETVKQTGVKFHTASDIDWKKPFTLNIGTGWISTIEYFPESGFYSIDVLYDPYKIKVPIGSVITVSVTEIKYGLLYNWYAVNDGRNICSVGWHVPTETEIDILITNCGGWLVAGGAMKEINLVYWNTPNTGATNSSGLSIRGAGNRSYFDGSFDSLKYYAWIWTISENIDNPGSYEVAFFQYNEEYCSPAENSGYYPQQGFSVRPIKDSTTLTIQGSHGIYIGNDLKQYETTLIGTQEWVTQNLAETQYRTGASIPEVTDNTAWAGLTSGAMCAYNNDWNNAFNIIVHNMLVTADSTLITADNTIITVDSDI